MILNWSLCLHGLANGILHLDFYYSQHMTLLTVYSCSGVANICGYNFIILCRT